MSRFKGRKAGCIGPAMVILGVMAFVFGVFSSFVISFLSMKPGGQLSTTAGSNFWMSFGVVGLYLIAAGLFVLLFQGILWLVRKAGVAKSKE